MEKEGTPAAGETEHGARSAQGDAAPVDLSAGAKAAFSSPQINFNNNENGQPGAHNKTNTESGTEPHGDPWGPRGTAAKSKHLCKTGKPIK